MKTAQPLWKNGKVIIGCLVALLLGVAAVQWMVADGLAKRKAVNKSVLPTSSNWEESWGLANQDLSRGEFEKAEKTLAQTVSTVKEEGVNDSRLAASLNCLALIYEKQGNLDKASSLYKEALRIDESELGKDNPALVNELYKLARNKLKKKDYAAAAKLYQRALTINEKTFGKYDLRVGSNLRNLARAYDLDGKYEEAEKVCQRALEIDTKKFGESKLPVATDLNNLAMITARQKKFDRSYFYADRAMSIAERHPKHPSSAIIKENVEDLNNAIEFSFLQAKPDKAASFPTAAFDKAKDLKSKEPEAARELLMKNLPEAAKSAPGSIELAKYLVRLNNVLFTLGNDAAAIKFGELALKIFAGDEAKNPDIAPWKVNAESYLAMSYERLAFREQNGLNKERAARMAQRANERYKEAIKLAKEAPAGKIAPSWMEALEKGLAATEAKAGSN